MLVYQLPCPQAWFFENLLKTEGVPLCYHLRAIDGHHATTQPHTPIGGFYDIWVMRDAEGRQVDAHPPYLKHAYSRQRLESGLTFPGDTVPALPQVCAL